MTMKRQGRGEKVAGPRVRIGLQGQCRFWYAPIESENRVLCSQRGYVYRESPRIAKWAVGAAGTKKHAIDTRNIEHFFSRKLSLGFGLVN